MALEGWCELLAHLHKDLFPHSEVLQPMVIIPSFQDYVVPSHHAGSLGLELVIHPLHWHFAHLFLVTTMDFYSPSPGQPSLKSHIFMDQFRPVSGTAPHERLPASSSGTTS